MRRLAVFARSPVPGQVKTRLSPALPAVLAAKLYGAMLTDTLLAATACEADERWVLWADAPGDTPARFNASRQCGADLGARLRQAFDDLLPGTYDRALVIGSDTPPLTAAHLDEAFEALDQHDVVLGPTLDGGYWCIGLRRTAPTLFDDIPWSTREVLTRTLVRAHSAELRATTVATLEDLDTPQDVAMLTGALAAGLPACGTHARAALSAMGMLPTFAR